MRAVLIVLAAVMFGLAGGYAWSAIGRPPVHVHVPKVPKTKPLVIPETAADEEWQIRAEDGRGCAEVRARDNGALNARQPGNSAESDGDIDQFACEPHSAHA